MKNETGFIDTAVTLFFVFLTIFYLTFLFIQRFKLFNLEIFIYSFVAACVTSYVLHRKNNE